MSCLKTLNLNFDTGGDTPLDQAIYVASLGKIMACRGKWLFKYNATTGVKEAEMRWANSIINESYLTAIGSTIYVSGWRSVIERYPAVGDPERPERDIFAINGATMAVTGSLDFGFTEGSDFTNQFNSGPRNLVTDGTLLYGYSPFTGDLFKCDPSNFAATYATGSHAYNQTSIMSLEYDATNSALWNTSITSIAGGISTIEVSDKTALGTNGNSTPTSPTTEPTFLGVTYCPSNGKAYAVDYVGGRVYIINANEAFPGFNNFTYNASPIVLDADAHPVKLRYNSVDGLVYVAGWSNDKVYAINPATNTVVATYTGFTDPFDVVFTTSKKFAVQNSSVALREIV